MKRLIWPIISIVLLCMLIFTWFIFPLIDTSSQLRMTYEISDEVFGNPLMGYAPVAGCDNISDDVTLLYVDISWREWEPEKGKYDIEAIIDDNQLERWRAEGRHIVLRFMCDKPDDERHMDIPDWLYDEIGGQGTWYDISYGQGFAPDYNNALMIEYHRLAVEALGEALGEDGFVAYVQLGSLGHWGEWHVDYNSGIQRMPPEAVRDEYIRPWIAAFPHARILMRRPFNAAVTYGFGLYNDMTGHAEDTERWLSWIANGGEYSQTGEETALSPMHEPWNTAPIGGELTSSMPMEQLMVSDLEQLLELVERSHMTFIGPKVAEAEFHDGYYALLDRLGYRIAVTEAGLEQTNSGVTLTLTWENFGAAPLYQDWPVNIYVCHEDGSVIETVQTRLQLSSLVPGITHTETVTLHTEGLLQGALPAYTICVGIVDPMTGENAVRLAMQAPQLNNATILFAPEE